MDNVNTRQEFSLWQFVHVHVECHLLPGDRGQIELGAVVGLSHHPMEVIPHLSEVGLDLLGVMEQLGERQRECWGRPRVEPGVRRSRPDVTPVPAVRNILHEEVRHHIAGSFLWLDTRGKLGHSEDEGYLFRVTQLL